MADGIDWSETMPVSRLETVSLCDAKVSNCSMKIINECLLNEKGTATAIKAMQVRRLLNEEHNI